MELENRSLPGPAAAAWEKYLDRVPTTDDRLEICYRVGKLYLQAEQYAPAAAAFVHAEQLAGDNAELKQRIGPQLVTCLRRLGLYGEVGRELSRRVETGAEGTAQGKMLATLAGEPLTDADLDRLIERRVDQMLAVQGLPPTRRPGRQCFGNCPRRQSATSCSRSCCSASCSAPRPGTETGPRRRVPGRSAGPFRRSARPPFPRP